MLFLLDSRRHIDVEGRVMAVGDGVITVSIVVYQGYLHSVVLLMPL